MSGNNSSLSDSDNSSLSDSDNDVDFLDLEYDDKEFNTYIYNINREFSDDEYHCLMRPYKDFNISTTLPKELCFEITDEIIKEFYEEPNSLVFDSTEKIRDDTVRPIVTTLNYKDYEINLCSRYVFCYYSYGKNKKCNFRALKKPQNGDHYDSFVILKDDIVVGFAAW